MARVTTMDLTTILEKTVSPDKNALEAAQRYLEQAAQTNLTEFLRSLSEVLQGANNSPVAPMAAGLQIKNSLTSKDNELRTQYQQCWLSFPQEARMYIKNNILSALGTETIRPSLAAQCERLAVFGAKKNSSHALARLQVVHEVFVDYTFPHT
ncbi:hypothetical protein MRX96_006296 [Rhipicephalus microplus]